MIPKKIAIVARKILEINRGASGRDVRGPENNSRGHVAILVRH